MEQLATGYGLIEGPVWDADRGLIFSDVLNGGAYALSADGSVSPIIEHRKGMGGMALHERGGMVVSGRNISLKPKDGGTTVLLHNLDPSLGEVGFNDLCTDEKGRIYVGSLAFRPVGEGAEDETPQPGSLYRIELDGTAERIAEGIQLTNGLGFSPDGTQLYHSDTLTNAVWAFPVSSDGSVGARTKFGILGDDFAPDGLAVAVDGSVWVADARGGQVAVFEASGIARTPIPVPLPMVTSVCFGGPDLRDLYIVTGSRDSGRENGGTIFRMRTETRGVPVPLARVKPRN